MLESVSIILTEKSRITGFMLSNDKTRSVVSSDGSRIMDWWYLKIQMNFGFIVTNDGSRKLIHRDTIEAEAHLPTCITCYWPQQYRWGAPGAVSVSPWSASWAGIFGSVMKIPGRFGSIVKIPVERQSLMDPRPRQIMSTTDMKYFLLFKIRKKEILV
jgi:hypothetical protein